VHDESSWTRKYWDAIDLLYWTPKYLGLSSIPVDSMEVHGDTVTIPKSMTNRRGPLYRRTRSGKDYWEYVQRQEETFNHIFDITFAILPGNVVSKIFNNFTRSGSDHKFESIGREIYQRYGWGINDNITSPDGYFVSSSSVLAVELKFNAKTSLDQLAKYVYLLVMEEKREGPKKHLDLVYITPSDPVEKFVKQVGLQPSEVSEALFPQLLAAAGNSTVRSWLNTDAARFRDVLNRLTVHCISWQEFARSLENFSKPLSKSPGDQTMSRLIGGLVTEIYRHPLSKAD